MTDLHVPFTQTAGSSPRAATSISLGTLQQTFAWLRPEELSIVSTPAASSVTVEIVDEQDGKALFDARVLKLLGVSGAEFLAHYDAGDAWETYDAAAVSSLSMLIPFAR